MPPPSEDDTLETRAGNATLDSPTTIDANSTPLSGPAGLIRVSEVLSALSFALDLTEGQPMGHSVRTCVFGMHIACEFGLPLQAQGDLYYALLMKDAGCSGNASHMFQMFGTDDLKAKRDVKTTDWSRVGWESLQYVLSHVRTGAPFLDRVRGIFAMVRHREKNAKELVRLRCERGSSIARRIGLPEATATAIHSLDELWNGAGQTEGLRGEEIPVLSRIINLAQTVDVFNSIYGRQAALEVAQQRSGRWFDPDLVRAFLSAARQDALWTDLDNAPAKVLELEPRQDVLPNDEATLDRICLAFADVIDAKSPFTYRHSIGVAGAAVAIAGALNMTEPDVRMIRRAALLHDIGKLSVSNTILDKPGPLAAAEWDVVRKHPWYTWEILRRTPGFSDLAEIAASHHEKLDGSGYFRGVTGDRLCVPARILVVADIYDALAANRPYREAIPIEQVFAMMQKDAPQALDANVLEALKCSTATATSIAESLFRLSRSFEDASGKDITG